MVPFASTEMDYKNHLPLQECPGKHGTQECFLELEFPEVNDELVNKVFYNELNFVMPDDSEKLDKGIEVRGIAAGCRPKTETLASYKAEKRIPQEMCIPNESDGLAKRNHTCGCYELSEPEKCENCPPATGCNSAHYIARNLLHHMYIQRAKISKKNNEARRLKVRAEEL